MVDILDQERFEMKSVYIAGPMRGIPEFNFPAFFQAEDEYTKQGFRVFNPARKDQDQYGDKLWKGNKTGSEAEASANTGFNIRDALAWDTQVICLECTDILMLKGWEKSSGASAEWALARALGLEIHYQ